MTTNEKIAALRAAAQAAGAHGVLLMTSDPHSSEYLPAYYNSLPFFSGFTGENSTLVVTLTGSALWCDGRFYVQGDRQLAGTEIECMHAGSAGVPTVEEYLTAHFAAGQTLLLDGSCVPATIANGYAAALAKSGAKLESKDIVSPLWESLTTRPSRCHRPGRDWSGLCGLADQHARTRPALYPAGRCLCPCHDGQLHPVYRPWPPE